MHHSKDNLIFRAYTETNSGTEGSLKETGQHQNSPSENASCQIPDIRSIALVSCGHIFAKHGRKINRPEGRADWLLFYVAKESETFYLDTRIEAPAGSFLIYKPHERQEHVYLGNKTAEFYYIHFTAPYDFDPFGLNTSTVYFTKHSPSITNCFEEIISEVQLKQPCYEQICIFRLLEVMNLLKRKLIHMHSTHTEHIHKIGFVTQLMHREYEVNRSLEDFAEMCQMSKYHFLRVFEEITGSTPIAYRNLIRMEHARELLENTGMSVKEISESLGFESPAYFCDAFKKENKVSPTGYRKQFKG